MAVDWPIMTIAECASTEPYSTQIGPFGKALMADEYKETGVPVLRGVNVNRGRFHDDDFVFIDEETADRLWKFESRPDDVLLVHKGTLGQIGLMPADRKYRRYVMGNSMMRVRCDPSKLLPEYLYYWLSSAEGQHYLSSRVSQVGVPQLQTPLKTLREAELPVPTLSEQRAIAHILGTLDDKIELNRRMNETLEQIARALFKSWFVDFDPVRAKSEGRDLGLPSQIADLFPDSFEESELGEIPEGWRVGILGDVADHPRRSVQPNAIDPSTPYIALEHMPKRCIALAEWGAADGLASNKFEFKKGEILFGKLRPYFHKVGVAPVDGVCSTDIVVVRPRTDEWFGFTLGHVSSDSFVEYTNAGSTGTKMPRTSWTEMARYPVVVPSGAIGEAFSRRVRFVVDRIVGLIHESRTLAALRDALLPKLISGELRVKDAERFIERKA
jgi:type I restriction enzyme S subunit